MRARSNLRTAAALLFFTLSLTLLPATPARAMNIAVRTAICDREAGYAEFRNSATETDEDLSGLVPEYPLDEIWGAPYMEHSWRCDLSDKATITIRYTLQPISVADDRMKATIWINEAKVTTREVYLHVAKYFSEIKSYIHNQNEIDNNLDHIALDGQGLSICLSEKECEVIPWTDLPTEKDPGYKPGWLFRVEEPKIKTAPPRILTGQDDPICQQLYDSVVAGSVETDFPLPNGMPHIDKHGRGPYSFDIDNDGTGELVYTAFTHGDLSKGYYVVVEGGHLEEEAIDLVMKNTYYFHYYKMSLPDGAYPVTALYDFGGQTEPRLFPIYVNGKVYVYGRPNSLDWWSTNRSGADHASHEIIECIDGSGPKIICGFSAPYDEYDE